MLKSERDCTIQNAQLKMRDFKIVRRSELRLNCVMIDHENFVSENHFLNLIQSWSRSKSGLLLTRINSISQDVKKERGDWLVTILTKQRIITSDRYFFKTGNNKRDNKSKKSLNLTADNC